MRRKILILITSLSLAAILTYLWILRVDQVNKAADYPEIAYHTQGEVVSLGNNQLSADFVCMDGYEVKVIGSYTYDVEEYLAQYDLSIQDYIIDNGYEYLGQYAYDFLLPKKVVVVDIELINIDNTDTGVDFQWWPLIGRAASAQLDTYFYSLENPQMNGNTMASARLNSTAEVSLPFGFKRSDISQNAWDDLDSYALYLVISDFPVSHRLAIS